MRRKRVSGRQKFLVNIEARDSHNENWTDILWALDDVWRGFHILVLREGFQMTLCPTRGHRKCVIHALKLIRNVYLN